MKDVDGMPGFFKSIGKLFVYKEPKNNEMGFELLEDQNEGSEQPISQAPPKKTEKQKRKVRKAIEISNIKPIPIRKWNEYRKSDKSAQSENNPQQDSQTESNNKQDENEPVSADLSENLKKIRQKFDVPKNKDIVIREFRIGRKIKAFLVFIDGMINEQVINLSIFPRLMSKEISEEIGEEYPVDFLIENVIAVHNLAKEKQFPGIILKILNGYSAFFIDGCKECILIEARGYEKRSIDLPQTETVVKGAQEAFTEDLRTNLTLIRRIVRNENLVTEMLPLGKADNSKCAVLYIHGFADDRVIQEVKKRIKRIDTDFILGTGMVEQFIEDNPLMLFPQVISTERPDRTASFLMEGQVVIIAEGSPFSMAVPVTFFRLLHTSEDSISRWPYGTFLRLIRLLGLFCATLLPGLYIAMILFHPDVIPTELLISIALARESVPFPTIIEVLILESAFELIREGGIRIPSIMGQTLGIVGALILGQAAVSAGLVSPFVVIIVSVTALGSFIIPNYSLGIAIRIERFFFIFMGAFLGFYGIALAFFILSCFACSMKSFGVPFFSPIAPRIRVNPDVIIKMPIWMQKNRPDTSQSSNRRRQGKNVKFWFTEKSRNDEGGEKKR